jgi:hypothetical protein
LKMLLSRKPNAPYSNHYAQVYFRLDLNYLN